MEEFVMDLVILSLYIYIYLSFSLVNSQVCFCILYIVVCAKRKNLLGNFG
jgi:hypothetical protein